MKVVDPEVFLIGESKIVSEGMQSYLDHLEVSNWDTNAPSDSEKLMEVFGRGCYESWYPGYNKNITRVREGNDIYLSNIIKSHHGSVLEGCMLNFAICNVSRILTHELLTHRVGIHKSQESLRYVRKDEISFYIPNDLDILAAEGCITRGQKDTIQNIFIDSVCYLEHQMNECYKEVNIDTIKNFDIKKRITSLIRRIFPDGGTTNLIWSANFRTLRHTIEVRTDRHAEEEMRNVFNQIADIVFARYPNVFSDHKREKISGYDEITFSASKI
ncbi:MAG: FAD-dependent thymidylate synthase [Thermodesulfobacteriota bacterium]